MNTIPLTGQLSFAVDQEEKRLRFIVFNGDDELVCHKADRAELNRFIQTDANHLFKGRLQLYKKGDHVIVNVKGNIAGIIGLTEFEKLIS
jgi:hypothetical protein